MPHLSPMHWLMSLLLMWTILSMMMTKTWWSQSPSFTKHNTHVSKSNKQTHWTWL